jgi:hypothetical protein
MTEGFPDAASTYAFRAGYWRDRAKRAEAEVARLRADLAAVVRIAKGACDNGYGPLPADMEVLDRLRGEGTDTDG